ncbi:MAG: VOC family protein [Rhodobacteraceae bacterium]|nr:VOC family protein [Paracoccaceae bacterium]
MSFTPKDFTVWIEIPVRDLDKAVEYYARVTGADLIPEEIGPNRTARFPTAAKGVAGHLYEGAPAPEGAGPTIHLMFDGPLETALERVWEAGGKVVSDPISIPDGRFAYTLDPDGNSIGLFEAA